MKNRPMIKKIAEIITEELKGTQEKYGDQFHSTHEAYAVTLEERDEAITEVAEVDKSMEEFWLGIIENDLDAQQRALLNVKGHATRAAYEYVQVAAMATQALNGYAFEPEHED